MKSILESAERLWREGDEAGAVVLLKEAYEKNPSNATLAFEYGHMLGQISSGPASDRKTRWRAEAIEMLARLCAHLDELPAHEQWKIRRHYYFYSGLHLQNRALGYAEIERGNACGILSVGFGCLHHAIELAEKRSIVEARSFATEACDAFEKLLAIDAPKYGRLLSYALALTLLGRKQEAFDVTHRAASLFELPAGVMHEHTREMERLSQLSCGS